MVIKESTVISEAIQRASEIVTSKSFLSKVVKSIHWGDKEDSFAASLNITQQELVDIGATLYPIKVMIGPVDAKFTNYSSLLPAECGQLIHINIRYVNEWMDCINSAKQSEAVESTSIRAKKKARCDISTTHVTSTGKQSAPMMTTTELENAMKAFLVGKLVRDMAVILNNHSRGRSIMIKSKGSTNSVVPEKTLNSMIFRDLGCFFERLFFGGILHCEAGVPGDDGMKDGVCRLIMFCGECISSSAGFIVPAEHIDAINQGDTRKIVSLSTKVVSYPLHSFSREDSTRLQYPDSRKSMSAAQYEDEEGIDMSFDPNQNPFTEAFNDSLTPESRAIVQSNYDWWEGLTVNERREFAGPRFAGVK